MAKSKLQAEGLSDEQQEFYLRALEKGLSPKLCAELIGENPNTVRGWMTRGKAGKPGDEVFADFYREAKKANASGAQNYWDKLITLIDTAEPRDALRGVMWILERRYEMTVKAAEAKDGPEDDRSVTINIHPPAPLNGDD